VFPEASIKAPPLEALPLGATIRVERMQDTFAVSANGYLPARHLLPLEAAEPDFVAVAERFVGAPYLWGGKTGLGVDCSGLVQVSLNACGVPSPRDSDMQEAGLGSPVQLADLKRGDLLFWKGHVAIARDAATLIHANAFHMQVAIEPAVDAIARIRAGGSEVTSVRRVG
jgi:cell wall-associated NlpC family hydrolase